MPVDSVGSGSQSATRRLSVRGGALVALVCAVGIAAPGAYLAAGMFQDGRDAAALQADAAVALHSPAAIGQDVPTSFGVVAVEGMTKNAGPTAKKLAGVTHGIQSLVPPNKIQVNATVTITNLQATPLHYSPSQFALHADRGDKFTRRARQFRLVRSSIAGGTLQPDASIEATLSFVAPRDGSKLWMTFEDLARPPPVLFDLGRTDRTPPGAFNGYHHARQR
jgi:hypothetical protein